MMKKIMTTALFLAAGTAFSHAAIATWSETPKTSASGTSIATWSTPGTGSTLTPFFQWNTQWSVVFTVDKSSFGDNALTLLSVDSNNGNATTIANSAFSGIAGVKYYSNSGTMTLALAHYNNQTVNVSGASFNLSEAQKDLTFVLSRDSFAKLTLNVYFDGDFSAAKASANSGGTEQNYSDTNVLAFNFGGKSQNTSGAGFANNDSLGSFSLLGAGYSSGSVASLEDLTAYYSSSVPEPSAFGLLAGLGALALVASRRRRSRK